MRLCKCNRCVFFCLPNRKEFRWDSSERESFVTGRKLGTGLLLAPGGRGGGGAYFGVFLYLGRVSLYLGWVSLCISLGLFVSRSIGFGRNRCRRIRKCLQDVLSCFGGGALSEDVAPGCAFLRWTHVKLYHQSGLGLHTFSLPRMPLSVSAWRTSSSGSSPAIIFL